VFPGGIPKRPIQTELVLLVLGRMTSPIATRAYESNGKPVVASVYQPAELNDGTWSCVFKITGLANAVDESAQGVDAFQALMMAFEAIRVRLEDSGESISLQGGEPGDFDIPYAIPSEFGLDVAKRLNQMCLDEIDKLVQRPKP